MPEVSESKKKTMTVATTTTDRPVLPKEEYARIMSTTPIPAVDIIVTNGNGHVLLGRRNDHPAKGYWFVPGGRLLRDETIQEAVHRISMRELGVPLAPGRALGVYHHRHTTDAMGTDTGCHYVVFAVSACWPSSEAVHPVPADDSHENLRFWSVHSLLADAAVHEFTKNYFLPFANNHIF